MTILPGLTSTVPEAIYRFVADLGAGPVRAIALFPTAIPRHEREALYAALEAIPDLSIPHVHARNDFETEEIEYLMRRFGTEVVNIHPRKDRHAFGEVPPELARRFFVENVIVPPEDDELAALGGICPDFSHLESARLRGLSEYVDTVVGQMRRFPVGCCHVSAIRRGLANAATGGWDHHRFGDLADLDYLVEYREFLPARWVSLELENSLAEQLSAIRYLRRMLGPEASGTEPASEATGP